MESSFQNRVYFERISSTYCQKITDPRVDHDLYNIELGTGQPRRRQTFEGTQIVNPLQSERLPRTHSFPRADEPFEESKSNIDQNRSSLFQVHNDFHSNPSSFPGAINATPAPIVVEEK